MDTFEKKGHTFQFTTLFQCLRPKNLLTFGESFSWSITEVVIIYEGMTSISFSHVARRLLQHEDTCEFHNTSEQGAQKLGFTTLQPELGANCLASMIFSFFISLKW